MHTGLFIVFEGMDGAGKSTHIRLLCERLEAAGVPAHVTREPGGCRIAERIRALVLDAELTDMHARTEALLYAAARAQHVAEVIVPQIERGNVVICDRFLMSSLAYQGYGRMLGESTVRAVNELAIAGVKPDVTFYLRLLPEDGIRRNALGGKAADRIEREDHAFRRRVFEGFEALAANDPDIALIDAAQPQELIAKQIWREAMRRLQVLDAGL